MHVGLPYEAANSDDVPAGARLAAGYMHSHPSILGKAGLSEWDAATKGKKLPKHVKKSK